MVKIGVDVIVVSYRSPDDLTGFVHALKKSDPAVPYTLFIVNVDPTSYDSRVGRLLAAEATAGYLEFNENVGYARACNQASLSGSHEVLAFFNADTRITPGVLEGCYRALHTQPSWGILGPRQVNESKRLTHAGIFGTLSKPQHRAWLAPDAEKYGDIKDAVSVSGSAYFVKRDVWDELRDCPLFRDVAPEADGAFLPTNHYYEETWCSYHAQAHGYRVVYYGPQTMIHRWHGASKVGGWAERQMKDSQELFRAACDHHQIPHD